MNAMNADPAISGAAMQWLKDWVRRWIPLGRLSYAQEGEDLVLARLLGPMARPGFFVDIGAHHPTRYSNTYYFYRRGWRGINVDPLPGTARLFRRQRPRDISLECGVAAQQGVLTYHAFNDPALNTFSAEEAARKNVAPYRLLGTSQVPVHTLADILTRHLPPGQSIDFLSIDAEGLDHDIVASNDWEKYRPRWVLVELLQTALADVAGHPTACLLQTAGYAPCAKTLNTVFFRDQRVPA